MTDFVVVIRTSNPLALCKLLVTIFMNLKQMQLLHLGDIWGGNNLRVKREEGRGGYLYV